MNKLPILSKLAKLGAHMKTVRISSRGLGDRVGCSQQTAARWLSKLSEEGLIERKSGPKGQEVKLTPEGLEKLKPLWEDLRQAFGRGGDTLTLSGKLVSGMGEGEYYVDQDGYREQFKEKLGFEPYTGTLDLQLDEESLALKKEFQKFPGKKIEGFSTGERSFGDVKCFPAKIEGEEAAVVIPSRTHHEEEIIEIISPIKIREEHNLKDGDELEIEVKI